MRKCEKCGANIPLQQGRGRRRRMCETCSPSRKPKSRPTATASAAGLSDRSGVVSTVTAELIAVGMLESHQGQLALVLANRIETGDDTGAALAQMVRQLRETMTSALSSAEPEAVDPLDELRAKRERRGA